MEHSTDAPESVHTEPPVQPKLPQSHSSKRAPWRTLVLLCVVVLLSAGAALSFVATKSLPGDRLYTFKTHTLESILSRIRFNAESKTAYDITRLENRLNELTLLSRDHATSTPETLSLISTLASQHSEDALTILSNSASTLSFTTRIDLLAHLTNVTGAQEMLVEGNDEFLSISSAVQDTSRKSHDALSTTITTFASTNQADLQNYLSSQIEIVTSESKVLAHGSMAAQQVAAHTEEAGVALRNGSVAEALISLLRAREAIALDRYLFAAEREQVEDMPAPSSEIPEGN